MKVFIAASDFELFKKYKEDNYPKDNNVIWLPETILSPWEQIQWAIDHITDDSVVFTMSPYIVNAFNISLVENKLIDNFEINLVCFDKDSKPDNPEVFLQNLYGTDQNGNRLVDTYDLSEPISYIYKKYQELTGKKDEEFSYEEALCSLVSYIHTPIVERKDPDLYKCASIVKERLKQYGIWEKIIKDSGGLYVEN